MTFSLKLEELMDTNVSVLQSEKDRGKELLEKVRAVQPGKVVIEKDGTSYLAEFDEETGELLFLSCKKINAATADISKLLEEVEHVDRFLIYDGKRCKGVYRCTETCTQALSILSANECLLDHYFRDH